MKSSQTAIAVFVILLLSFGCSSDKPTKPSEPPVVLPVYAKDYIHFPDTNQVLQVAIRCQPNGYREPFLEDEAVIGEPYTDVNDNGQYDVGVDIFVRSSDPAVNQDLNYNGRHDGPENTSPYEWGPGIPFDDLDGNGTMRIPTGNMIPDEDCQYAPFIDWNGNGQWDSSAVVAEQLYHYRSEYWAFANQTKFSLSMVYDTMAYRYISDSGNVYWMGSDNWPTSPGFVFYSWAEQTEVTVNNSLKFFIADSSQLASDSGTIVSADISLPVPYFAVRHITLDTSLQFDDTLFENLLFFRFDSIHNDYAPVPGLAGAFWEFYFDRAVGLLAYRMTSNRSREPITFYFHRPWTGTFPIPLTKVDRP